MPEEQIRDGISQKMRLKAALQPDYVRIDGQSLEDMLRFLYKYSDKLRYFDENNRENGTWQAFFPFPSDEALSDIKKFLENPASLSEDKAQKYQEPHFVLLLTFLQLLERVKRHLNGFTKKHLDFYYQDILRMQKKKARPDRVNVLVELAKQNENFKLPAGTEFYAGKDSAGKSLTYKTDEDTQLNHAKIELLRAVYVDKQLVPIQESIQKAREEYFKNKEDNETNRQLALLEMLKAALGEPELGDKLPKYPLDGQEDKKTDVNFELVNKLYNQLEFVKNKLKLTFDEFNGKYNSTDSGERKKLEAEVKKLDLSNSLSSDSKSEELYNNIKRMESYFYMQADNFYSLVGIVKEPTENSDKRKDSYSILSSAYEKKISSGRKKELAKLLVSEEKIPGLIARRKRELQDDIITEKEKWQGLYAIEDARKATVSNDLDAKDTAQRWKTFGQFCSDELVSDEQKQKQPKPAEFGLAISSPVLLLTQGYRTINLTFEFSGELPLLKEDSQDWLENFAHLFQVSLSTEEGWIDADHEKDFPDPKKPGDKIKELEINLEEKKKKLEIKIAFSATKESIIALSPEDNAPYTSWPALKILYRSVKGTDSLYNALAGIPLANITLQVGVSGLSNLTLWNDTQELDNTKPFQPFGPTPIVGSRFHIAHSELAAKKLSDSENTPVKFNITWANLNIISDNTYYKNYPIEIKLPENGETYEKLFKIKLGKNNDQSIEKEEMLLKDSITLNNNHQEIRHYPKSIYWELQNPDFQHSVYPALAAKKATELAVAIANKDTEDTSINPANYHLNPPFTPVIKKLTINYNASARLSDKQNEIKLFHIHPFGYADVTPVKEGGEIKYPSFLPQYDRAGELYIGLENLKPPQHLSMFFQMAEGSADAEMNPSPVYWDYLDGNEWQPLENGGVLQDGTRGLINSGIIKFALPAAENPSTLLPPELYWLRASVRKRPNSVCDTVAIHTQAVTATLVDNDNAPDHFTKPLAEETIKKLLHPHPAIKAVHQPYTSFGGKTAEEDKLFYTRVSERLRHKQRALTVWDYEHLVLERFPQIYKVKCIPANASRPGSIDIVVIPDICNRLPADPFEPKAPINVLTDIQEYLQNLAPDSANIVVKNAHYVSFQIRMGVRFRQGYEEGYYANRLQDELNRFLAPWAYTEGADIVFGGKIYASSIINFVERLPYVDYIAQFNFFPIKLRDGENSISAKEAADVLVPERKHFIDAIPEGGYQFGINHMRIGLDFQVADNK